MIFLHQQPGGRDPAVGRLVAGRPMRAAFALGKWQHSVSSKIIGSSCPKACFLNLS